MSSGDRQAQEALTFDERVRRTEKLLSQPLPKSLNKLRSIEYSGPNSGLVNGLLAAAARVARGAVQDGADLATMLADVARTLKGRDLDHRVVEIMDVVRRVLERERTPHPAVSRSDLADAFFLRESFFDESWSESEVLNVTRCILRNAPDDDIWTILIDVRKLMVTWAEIEHGEIAHVEACREG